MFLSNFNHMKLQFNLEGAVPPLESSLLHIHVFYSSPELEKLNTGCRVGLLHVLLFSCHRIEGDMKGVQMASSMLDSTKS